MTDKEIKAATEETGLLEKCSSPKQEEIKPLPFQEKEYYDKLFEQQLGQAGDLVKQEFKQLSRQLRANELISKKLLKLLNEQRGLKFTIRDSNIVVS